MSEVRVRHCFYNNGKRCDLTYPGFTPIVVLTKLSKYGSLGPYVLKNEKGRCFRFFQLVDRLITMYFGSI